ncbi:2-oxoglutarate-Fe(II)-dependent oxygenase superfamily protein [Chitinophaga polysaccharea]|uniref:2-oxoglutarate-Fe(II)-dependent oxygenase superfamily protein n=2 Tax=Chitinophaga polysaccharea TaxID=1293035 RepID=A0A561PN86_9BACT|nr:2-oxoglutarate-Fe(II)-dependent oxygenase superfamily protein [Chitinophaga polysaccharea]
MKLDKRIYLLVYLNENLDPSNGGNFELQDKEMKSYKMKILPLFNRLALFNTTDFSYQAHLRLVM